MNRIAWRVGAASTHEVSIVSVHAKPNFELVSYLTNLLGIILASDNA